MKVGTCRKHGSRAAVWQRAEDGAYLCSLRGPHAKRSCRAILRDLVGVSDDEWRERLDGFRRKVDQLKDVGKLRGALDAVREARAEARA